jgi:LytS/YehU family sensor histidine kinase
LIKIGGLLFGPIIGIFIGAATDILSVALTAGMFHYGYFIAAMLFGALSGFIRVFINNSKKNIVKLWFYCIAFTLCCTILTDFFIFYQPLTEFNITILNLNIVLQKS